CQTLAVFIQGLHHRDDLSVKESIFLVGEANFFGALLSLLLVEKRLAFDRDFLLQLVVAQLLITIKDNLGDERFLMYEKGEAEAVGGRIGFDLDIFEIPVLIEYFDRATDVFLGVGIAGLQGQPSLDGG